jgi:Cu/Ag efflux protein CusF
MKRIVMPLVAGLALTAATVAYGASASGAIKSIDPTAHSITLDNGQVFVFGSSMKLSTYKVGEKVKITFAAQNGTNMATAVAPA